MAQFLFDENVPVRIATALKELGRPIVHVQHAPGLGKGATDSEVLAYANDNGYRLISLDRRMKADPVLRAQYVRARVGVYFLIGKKKGAQDPWDLFLALAKGWREIERHATKSKPPYMMLVKASGSLVTFK